MSPVDASPWMTVKQAARYLNTSENALRVAMCRRAEHLPKVYYFGRKPLFKKAELEAAIKPAPH